MREAPGRDRYLTHEEERAILAECAAIGDNSGADKRAEWEYMADLVTHPCHYEAASVDWAGHRFMVLRKRLRMVEGVCLHVLRHTCAARLLSAGVDIYTVSKWLGHSSVKVTERYAKLQVGMLVGARTALISRRPVDGHVG